MKRVLCIWLPDFPLQKLFIEQPELKSRPTVLYTAAGPLAEVSLPSSDARRHGICAGMSLSEAQALLDVARFLPLDPDASLHELQRLAEWCHRYSPISGVERSCGADCLVMDITGCSHLFGGECGLTRQLVVDLAARGYFAHVAVAGTIGASWAIARFGHCAGTRRRLRSLPAESLRLPSGIVERLREFELNTVGCLLDMSRESLPSRFGTQLIRRLDQMFGRCGETLVPVKCPDPVFVQWSGDDLTGHPASVLHFCEERLPELLTRVCARGEAVLQLTLILRSESTDSVVIETRLNRPTDSVSHLIRLLNMKLDSHRIPACLTGLKLTASATAALPVRQRCLFHRDDTDDRSEVSRLIDRLAARLGQGAVVHPETLPEVVPEQAIAWRTVSGMSAGVNRPACPVEMEGRLSRMESQEPFVAAARPLQLLTEPEPVDVQTDQPVFSGIFRPEAARDPFDLADDRTGTREQVPSQIHWDHCSHRFRRYSGFERIETAWWQASGNVHRDYCRLETRTGSRFWLFRDSHNCWFLHGVFE